MSQVTGALVIADGQTTPANLSFAPERVAPELSVFTERSASFSSGFKRITVTFSPASAKRKTDRINISLAVPVIQTVAGVEQVTHTNRFDCVFVVPDSATAAERADLRALAANALDNALLKGLVTNLDPLY